MKNISSLVSIILLSSTFLFAQTKDEKSKVAIRKVLDEQVAAWNRGDIEDFMNGYWNSPELTFISGDNLTKGWQPTLDRYKSTYDSRARMGVLSFEDLVIELLNKKSAVVNGRWSLAREKDNPHGRFTLILKRFKEGWRIVHDHTS